MPDEYIRLLSGFSACDVADGLQNVYGLSDGGYFPNLSERSCKNGKSVVGRAYTVLFAPASDPRPAVNYIDAIPEGSVVTLAYTPELQTTMAPYTYVNNAIFGGLMAGRAQFQGASGTVVFGCVRDVDEFESLHYPVYSYGLGATASKGVVKPVAVGVPLDIVTCAAVPQEPAAGEGAGSCHQRRRTTMRIESGDYIVCDAHGMVRIPTANVDMEKLISYIKSSIEADQLVARDIARGEPAEASKKRYRSALSK